MERRLAAIVAADLVGNSSLMAEDEAGTITAVSNLLTATVEPLVSRHGGHIVKLMGDVVRAVVAVLPGSRTENIGGRAIA
jgi:adenylate cyclase